MAVPALDRIANLCGHVIAGLSPAASSSQPAELDVFIDVTSIDCYLALEQLVTSLGCCRLHWRNSKAKARMCVPVGSAERMASLSKKQAYQLRVQQTYAKLLGLPLDVPGHNISATGFAAALAYMSRHETPEAMHSFLRGAFALVFDGAKHQQELDIEAMGRLLAESGGSAERFVQWHGSEDAKQALQEDLEREAEHSVWTTPFVADQVTKEVYLEETTLPLLALQLRRRGFEVPEVPEAISRLPQPRTPVASAGRRQTLDVYVDLKSPYAYMAIEPTYALEEDFHVDLVWKPYVLDIAGVYGSAEVGARNNRVRQGSDKRSPAQWKAVKYSYANVRRYAAERCPKLTVYGTRKIWDTRLVSMAMLFAAEEGCLRAFQQRLWPPFWRREVDPEDVQALLPILQSAGVERPEAFKDFVQGAGRERLEALQREAAARGVFGVPTYVLEGQLFFGREHLPLLRRLLFEGGSAKRYDESVLRSPYLWTRNELFADF